MLYSSLSVRVLGQPYSLTSFGLRVGFLSDLAMCMVAKDCLFSTLSSIVFYCFIIIGLLVFFIPFCPEINCAT